MPKEKQEHVAIIDLKVAIFIKKGKELHGPVLNQEQMKQEGIEHETKIQISGFDKFECIKKLKEAIDGLQV